MSGSGAPFFTGLKFLRGVEIPPGFFSWLRIGGERVVVIAAASWGLVTAATPLLAQLGSHVLALMTISRFLMGLSQGELRRAKKPPPNKPFKNPAIKPELFWILASSLAKLENPGIYPVIEPLPLSSRHLFPVSGQPLLSAGV